MAVKQISVAPKGAGARGGPGNRTPALKEWYTVVVYERKRIKTVVLYVGGRAWEVFVFKIPTDREIRGVVKRTWLVGGTRAYSMRVHAKELAELIDMYAHEEATRKISLLDDVYRAAVIYGGYKVHDNALYVELWLNHKLGELLFPVGDPRERELGECIKHFTHSYGIWRMVTPPWATVRC